MQTGQDNVVIGNTLIDGGVTDGTLLVEDTVLNETASDDVIAETLLENNAEFSPSESSSSEVSPSKMNSTPLQPEYNGIDRNAWIFGFNPQSELWNGRLAMIGFVAYALWDIKGYSVLRDVLHFIR